MKYTIMGLQQEALVSMGLDLKDAAFIRWFIDFRGTDRMKVVTHEGDQYYWVNYASFIEDMPIVGFKKQMLMLRMRKMQEVGLLYFYLEKNKQGTRTYYRFDPEKLEGLLSSPARSKEGGYNQLQAGVVMDYKGGCDVLQPKDPSSRDSSTRRSNIPYDEITTYLNDKLNLKRGYSPTSSYIRKAVKARWNEGHDLQDFKKVIEVKVDQWANDKAMCKYLRPQTLFGTKFEAYLAEWQMDNPEPVRSEQDKEWLDWVKQKGNA